ncbi:MAG: DNA-processing protein DprA [Candidatus Brocadiae bacterium]|nr:DNA-processing protein DprA [Candidatus Brocadiia bacterium]
MAFVDTVMTEDELCAWVALHSLDGIGAASLGRLLSRFGAARATLAATPAERESVPHVPAVILDGVPCAIARMADHARVAARLAHEHVLPLLRSAPAYPSRLNALASPPPLLYARGTLPADGRPTLGIVGTTEPSERGARVAATAAGRMAKAGWVIVSGHARGIDSDAHRGAFDAGGTTVLVLPTGILQFRPHEAYPPPDALARQATIVSEVHPEAVWATRAALARNRLIAAWSDALLVVECREKGGTLATLRHAASLRRRTFVVRFRRPSLSAAGNAVAEEMGAQPVHSIRELQRLLTQAPQSSSQPHLPWRTDP